MMSIYYDEIHRRATDTWPYGHLTNGKPHVTTNNFEEWKVHWLNIAEKWANECKREGLINTELHIRNIISQNK